MKKNKTMLLGDIEATLLSGNRVQLNWGKKKTVMEYKDLWNVIFLLGDKERQDAMMPVRKEERMVFSRKHVIRLKKDMKAGEDVIAWCEVSIPETIVHAIAEENGAKVIIRKEDEASIETA